MAKSIQKSGGQEENFLQIQDLLYLCLANWKWFVLSVAITVSVAYGYILHTPPVYIRSASILIKNDAKSANSSSSEFGAFAEMGLFQSNVNVNNELLTLKSPSLMYEVVKRLHLDVNYYIPGKFHDPIAYGANLPITVTFPDLSENRNGEFTLNISETGDLKLSKFVFKGNEIEGVEVSGKFSEAIKTPLGRVVITPNVIYSAGKKYNIKVSKVGLNGATGYYASRLIVALSQEFTSVITISMTDLSTQRIDDVLSTLIAVYNENWLKDRNQIAISTSSFINDRLSVIENELGNVDEDISSYKTKHLLPDAQTVSSMYMTQTSQTNAEIMTVNNQLYMTRYMRNYLTNEINKNQLLPANTGIEGGNVESQITEYNTKVLRRNNLVANSSVENPLVVDMDKELAEIRKAILLSIDNQMVALNTRIKSLQQNVQQATDKMAATPAQTKYLLSVERQQKVKEELYLFLLQKREENELSQAFTAYNTRIITPPGGSSFPIAPRRKNIMAIAFVIGLAIPTIILFLKETLNTKLRGRKDLKNLTIPFIGEIPLFEKKGLFVKKHKEVKAIVVKEGNRDVINDAFRILRTNLEFLTESGKESNVILLTSFNPKSGKSFLSMNIAVSFAIKNKRVLVVDGDLRRATSSSYVESPKVGLSDFLSGRESDYKKVIVTGKIAPNLSVLPVGTIPPNPTELLFSDRMKTLVEAVRKEYDYVLIDCPPLELVADTRILEKLADRTIFVARAGLLERSMLRELEDIYAEKKYKNMAIILNGTKSPGKYGYKYGYGYGYHHYGYGAEKDQ